MRIGIEVNLIAHIVSALESTFVRIYFSDSGKNVNEPFAGAIRCRILHDLFVGRAGKLKVKSPVAAAATVAHGIAHFNLNVANASTSVESISNSKSSVIYRWNFSFGRCFALDLVRL